MSYNSKGKMPRQRRTTRQQVASAIRPPGPALLVENSDPDSGDAQAKLGKHRFSKPWEESDLILVVENEKFHVHRLILRMNSPVFKAMFKSQFKEATSNKIPLPDKKASEVLDFLKHIYYQHVQEPVEITLENVDHLLKLSDEYQVKFIFDPCIEFVKDQPIRRENVMQLLKLADLYDLDEVCRSCNDFLKDLRLETLSETVHLEDLDLKQVRHILVQRIEWLEMFLDKLYPFCHWFENRNNNITINGVVFKSVMDNFRKVMQR